jgi:hypothetical protein
LSSDSDLKYRLQLIFRRKGGDGENTRLFESFPSDVQRAIVAKSDLREGELPILAHLPKGERGAYLLTSRKIIWLDSQEKDALPLSEILNSSRQVKTAEEKMSSTKLFIRARTGTSHILDADPGPPIVGVQSMLLNVFGRKGRGLL